MTDHSRSVRRGERVRIAASTWNRIVDEVRTKPQFAVASTPYPPINFQVLCKNDSGSLVYQYGVLQITGVLVAPSGPTGSYTSAYRDYPGVVGAVPATGVGSQFVIATEPIEDGSVGLAAIDGIVQCFVDVSDETHRFAVAAPGDVVRLASAAHGPAAILWKQGGTGPQWSLVRIGSAPGDGCGEPITRANLGLVPGYDPTVLQLLGHGPGASGATGATGASGCVDLMWISTTECGATGATGATGP